MFKNHSKWHSQCSCYQNMMSCRDWATIFTIVSLKKTGHYNITWHKFQCMHVYIIEEYILVTRMIIYWSFGFWVNFLDWYTYAWTYGILSTCTYGFWISIQPFSCWSLGPLQPWPGPWLMGKPGKFRKTPAKRGFRIHLKDRFPGMIFHAVYICQQGWRVFRYFRFTIALFPLWLGHWLIYYKLKYIYIWI